MSVVTAESPALRARARRIPASVEARADVSDFVLAAVRLWQLPISVTERCAEAAEALATALLRRTTDALQVEVWLHLDAVRVRVHPTLWDPEGQIDPGNPSAFVDDSGPVTIDFGSGTAVIRLGSTETRGGADDHPDQVGVSGARHARAARRPPLTSLSRPGAAPGNLTKGPDDEDPPRQRHQGAGHRDGVPTARRG
jgi:hypothetical protein